MGRHQRGHIFERHGAFHVRFYQMVMRDGVVSRVQKSHKLCDKDRVHHSRSSKPVRQACEDYMRTVNTTTVVAQDMTVADFYEKKYLLYIEEIMETGERKGKTRLKKSTILSYKQIWTQHLEKHFGKVTLREYTPQLADVFLDSLTAKHSKNTIKHIKSLGSSIFKRAVKPARYISVNPWLNVDVPEDAVETPDTEHYTMEEVEDIISALVDHVDCQLIMALTGFLGIRKNECAALKWSDFDSEFLHIRRGVVHREVGTLKTQESNRSIPLDARVRLFLELWRPLCPKSAEGWLFPSGNDTPIDLHNTAARVIVPHVTGKRACVICKSKPKATSMTWKGFHSGRRGAATAVIEATGGNYAVAQALLGHKSMTTTLNLYKKKITPKAFADGMKAYELVTSKSLN